jgi:carbonic anhydrase/SulP family sulfate permease
VAGTKLILVLGHTRCGAVTTAVELYHSHQDPCEATGCQHLDALVGEIQKSIDDSLATAFPTDKAAYVDEVARRNVLRTMASLRQNSETLDRLVREGRIAIVGGMYNIATGRVEFLNDVAAELDEPYAHPALNRSSDRQLTAR